MISKTTSKFSNKIFFAALAALSFSNNDFVFAQTTQGNPPGTGQSANARNVAQRASPAAIQEQDIDKILKTKPPVGQVDGYYKLVQVSFRELGELDELLRYAQAEPDAAIRAMKVAAVKLKIADEQARLSFRQDQLQRAEKLYGHGTASARQAKLLRVGGPSLKALPAVGLGAGVIFATNAAAESVSEVRAVSMNADGPVPVRLEKSNIGIGELSELDAVGGDPANAASAPTSRPNRRSNTAVAR